MILSHIEWDKITQQQTKVSIVLHKHIIAHKEESR